MQILGADPFFRALKQELKSEKWKYLPDCSVLNALSVHKSESDISHSDRQVASGYLLEVVYKKEVKTSRTP